MEERNYYMVRAMNSTEQDFNIFTKKEIVAVGWSDIEFTQYKNNGERLKTEVTSRYYSDAYIAAQVIGRNLAQIRRFCEIKTNDFIIIPYRNKILLAVATGQQFYSEEDRFADLANQQKVSYQKSSSDELKVVPRNSLSEALQRRLRVRGSIVSDLWEFAGEIENLFAKDAYSYKDDFLEKEQELLAKSKTLLLNNIRIGQTNLQTGGMGLEHLVCELLECEGYEASVCSKKRFPGWADADVEATKDDRFTGTQKILIQVKHHQGISDDHGLNQLLEIQKLDEYNTNKLVFITTAEIDSSVEEKAGRADIFTMDGSGLIDWIFDNIDNLKEETKQKLRISVIPQIG